MRITQLLPSVHSGDAVGDSAFAIHRALQKQGIESVILGVHIDDHLRDRAIDFRYFARYDSPDTVHIYHFAVPSPITYTFKDAKGRKIVIYHNITPPHFFEGFSEELVAITTTGRHEIKLLAECTDLGLADSEFNRLELVQYGYHTTGVVPILLDFQKYAMPAAAHVREQFDDEKINILFVGRITPNKKQEDVIKAFHIYQTYVNPNARLLLVGKYNPHETYVTFLHQLIAELQVRNVYFSGHVTQQELNAYYQLADVLLSMSEHEGFFVPAVESFYFKLPVLAYNCTAIPYTLGNAGILINHKRYAEIAELIQLVVENPVLQQAIITAQTARLACFQKERILTTLFEQLGVKVL
ncbi:MAG: glycosyltransferase [Candidatus Vecturithrix sp.]|jgi:glycosyltransferase involved in cell wall biosynthesis|nr:glycosyltransferase [Candidatus Vecturithrix sp.]